MPDYIIYIDILYRKHRSNNGVSGGIGIVITTSDGQLVDEFNDATRQVISPDEKMALLLLEVCAATIAIRNAPAGELLIRSKQHYIGEIIGLMTRMKTRGWLNADGTPNTNENLWRRLDAAVSGHSGTIQWEYTRVREPGHRRCEEIARFAANCLIDNR